MTQATETLTEALYSGSYIVVNNELTQIYGKEASYLVGYLSGLMRMFESDSVYQSYTNFDEYADLKRRELNSAIEILEKDELLSTSYQSVPSGHRSFDGAKVRVFRLNVQKIVQVIKEQQLRNKQKSEETRIKEAKKAKNKKKPTDRVTYWFEKVDAHMRKNKLGKFSSSDGVTGFAVSVFDEFTTTTDEKTNNTFDFICQFQYDLERQLGGKVFSTPKLPNSKRVKHVEAQLKLLCGGKFFAANNWDSVWIDKTKLNKDSLFGTGIHSVDKIRERLIRAATNYYTAKKDTSCKFFGNRCELISLSEFIYDEGQSLFWYWYTYEPIKLVDLSWTEPYLKNIPEDMLKDCFIKERGTWNQHKLAIARMVRWIKQEINAQRFLVRQGKLNNKLCMTWIKGWFEDTNPYNIPYPDWDRPVFKSFINWMRETYDAEIKREKPKVIAGS